MTTRRDEDGGTPFASRTLAILLVAGVASFAAMVFLGGFGEHLVGPEVAFPSAYSVSAIGHAGVVKFLRGEHVTAVPRRAVAAARPGPRAPLVLAEPGREVELTPFFAEADAANAPLVLVLPKRFGTADPRRPRWLAKADTFGLTAVNAVLARARAAAPAEPSAGDWSLHAASRVEASCRTRFGRDLRVELEAGQLLSPAAGLEPTVACSDGILVARVPRGTAPPLYVVADPDLFANHALGTAEHAAVVRGLFVDELQADAAVFDETIHGLAAQPGLLEALLSFPLVVLTAHGLAVAALAVWAGGVRFGRPRAAPPALARGKEALIDSAGELAVARRPVADAAVRITEARLRRLARALGLEGAVMPGPDLAARIDAVLQARKLPPHARTHWDAVMTLARHGPDFGIAGAGTPRDDAEVLVRTAAMHDWIEEVTDGTRGHR